MITIQCKFIYVLILHAGQLGVQVKIHFQIEGEQYGQ